MRVVDGLAAIGLATIVVITVKTVLAVNALIGPTKKPAKKGA